MSRLTIRVSADAVSAEESVGSPFVDSLVSESVDCASVGTTALVSVDESLAVESVSDENPIIALRLLKEFVAAL